MALGAVRVIDLNPRESAPGLALLVPAEQSQTTAGTASCPRAGPRRSSDTFGYRTNVGDTRAPKIQVFFNALRGILRSG